MLPYLVGRVLQAILSMLVVISIVFVLARLSGNPVHLLLDVNATQQDVDMLTRHLGLDKPLLVQYAIYVKNIALGDFGTSILTRRPVTAHLWERLPATLELGVVAMVLSIALGVPIGVYSAVRRGGVLDGAARVFAVLGQSMPPFWLGGLAGWRARWSPASDPASLHAGLFYLRGNYAPDALKYAGGAWIGLHQVRSPEGTPRADRALETWTEERLAASHHVCRHALRAIPGGRGGDRDGVCLARAGTADSREYHHA